MYTYQGIKQGVSFLKSGYFLNKFYNSSGKMLQTEDYLGGYIEIQPDSWDGSTPVTDAHVNTNDPTAWGFPMSLSQESVNRIKDEMFNGENGIKYIRFPMGFAYRGGRNYDQQTGLAKNFGERWDGQNSSLKSWFNRIAVAGGGLCPEYWCFPPYWLTSGSLTGENEVWAGGSYGRSITLASIRLSDSEQYQRQVDALTDAIVNDLMYLNENIAPVVMFSLWNEPHDGSAKTNFGSVGASDKHVYSDLMISACKKAKEIFPDIKLFCASSFEVWPFSGIASEFLEHHNTWMWGYTHHRLWDVLSDADAFYKSSDYAKILGNKTNMFINEYEYSSPDSSRVSFYCANNMVRLINELAYGKAQVIHPIIHICKPSGQTSADANTLGYAMFIVNMNDGSVTPNPWAYNSWKMFNDNMLIGSKRDTKYHIILDGVAFVAMKKDGKLRLFMANNSSEEKEFSLDFDETKSFSCKLYDISNVGTQQQNTNGKTITFTLPAYSGLVYTELT